MKNLFILIATLLLSPAFLKAQTADPELNYIKSSYSKDKKTIVEEYMALDVNDAGKFWPVYAAYETRREKLAVARIKIIDEYANLGDAITAAQADKIATAALANNVSLSNLNLEFYKRMKAAVGSVKSAKFMQLETYLQNTWRGFVQENVPLIRDLEKTKN